MGTILIKCSAVAGTHEQVRFLEPAHRTAQVRAIYCEDLKRFTILPPHPARNVCCCTIPRTREGIAIGCQPRLVFRKVFHRAESDPGLIGLSLAETGENVANHILNLRSSLISASSASLRCVSSTSGAILSTRPHRIFLAATLVGQGHCLANPAFQDLISRQSPLSGATGC